MITTQDLWQLESLSDYLGECIETNEKVAGSKDTNKPHERGIAFGIRLANGDLIKAKKKLDAQIERLQKEAESPYLLDDLTYEGVEESA